MTTAAFANYFLAMAGAGAALIGLLFVAISIHPERTFGVRARRERQAVAAAAFTALVNAFFISSAALIPSATGLNAGIATLIVSPIALLSTLNLAARLLRYQIQRYRGRRDFWIYIVRSIALVVVSLAVYGLELVNAWALLATPNNLNPLYNLCGLLLGVYALGLTRAWMLLGAPATGLTSWLNPLAAEPDAEEATGAPEAVSTPTPTPASPSSVPAPAPAQRARE